jgi:hypothetical protein
MSLNFYFKRRTISWLSALVLLFFFSHVPIVAASEVASANPVEPEHLLLTGKISSVKSQPFMVPKAGDAWRYQIQWMMPEGEVAAPGQTVIIFDKSQIDNKIEQLEASLLRVTAQEQSLSIDLKSGVLQAKFDLKQKRSERDKSQLDANVPADYIAAKVYAENQFKLMQANSELAKAEQALKQVLDKQLASKAQLAIDRRRARLELQQALDGIEQLTLKAEIKGPILYGSEPQSEKKYAVGDTVQIGRQVASLPSMEDLEVVAWVNEVDVDKIAVGSQVNLRLDSQSDMSFTGQIHNIGRQALKQSGWGNSNWFKVRISFLPDKKVNIIPGMSVLVSSEVRL